MPYPDYTLSRALKKVIGDGLGNHTNAAATTWADINAAYSATLEAEVGDEIEISFSCQYFHSVSGSQLRIRFMANAVALPLMPTNGLMSATNGANSTFNVFPWMHTVVAGDLNASGQIVVKPQFSTDAATVTVRNDGTNGKPLFIVKNIGPVDPY